MIFKPNKVYRHCNARDLDILVVKIKYADQKRCKLLIRFVGMNSGLIRDLPSSRMDGLHSIEINSDDYKLWTLLGV